MSVAVGDGSESNTSDRVVLQLPTGDSLHFRSCAYLATLARLRLFARNRTAPILLEGESGTGKTTLAKLIHELSPRAHGPFQMVVLSAMDDALAGSELFGHVQGAFTDAKRNRAGHFVSAAGGTLFLDEVGKASKPIQQKLLHAIETGEVRAVGADRQIRADVRVVLATNVALTGLVERELFLPDLFARIANFTIRLPALRERRGDIPVLVASSIARHAPGCGYRTMPRFTDDLVRAMQRAPWPHNIRQLDATVHRLLIEAEGRDVVALEHCRDDLAYLANRDGSRQALTRHSVDSAIATAGSIAGAARLLGVDRTTFHRFRARASLPGVAPHAPEAPKSAAQQVEPSRHVS